MTNTNHTADSRSLPEIHTALRRGDVSASALMEQAAARYAEVGARNHAYTAWDGENALELARHVDALLALGRDTGPLMGMPVSVKDLFGLPGFRTHAGSPSPMPERWEEPGPIVRQLLGQLSCITGKTQTVEFAFGGLGTNPHWGTPRNPRDAEVHRVPGGSSAGAGVSIVEGSARLALGTDTSGSVRIPAAMTGVAGLKTTAGRLSTEGVVPLSTTLDTVGLLARDVTDLAFGYHALTDTQHPAERSIQPLPPRAIRLGVPDSFFWDDCSPGVAEAVQAALTKLVAHHVQIVPLELPGCDEAFEHFRNGGLAAAELAAFLGTESPGHIKTLDANVAARIRGGQNLSATEYLQRREHLQRLAGTAAETLTEVDALVTPTVVITPPPVDDVQTPEAYARANILSLRNTMIANFMGLCALTLPAGKDAAGMPVGLHLIAAPWRESQLLAMGRTLETVLGTGSEMFG